MCARVCVCVCVCECVYPPPSSRHMRPVWKGGEGGDARTLMGKGGKGAAGGEGEGED